MGLDRAAKRVPRWFIIASHAPSNFGQNDLFNYHGFTALLPSSCLGEATFACWNTKNICSPTLTSVHRCPPVEATGFRWKHLRREKKKHCVCAMDNFTGLDRAAFTTSDRMTCSICMVSLRPCPRHVSARLRLRDGNVVKNTVFQRYLPSTVVRQSKRQALGSRLVSRKANSLSHSTWKINVILVSLWGLRAPKPPRWGLLPQTPVPGGFADGESFAGFLFAITSYLENQRYLVSLMAVTSFFRT